MLYPQLKERSANHFHTAAVRPHLKFLISHIIQAIKEGKPIAPLLENGYLNFGESISTELLGRFLLTKLNINQIKSSGT